MHLCEIEALSPRNVFSLPFRCQCGSILALCREQRKQSADEFMSVFFVHIGTKPPPHGKVETQLC